MEFRLPKRRLLITYVAFILAFMAVAARASFTLEASTNVELMAGLLAFYLLLLVVEPFLIARSVGFLHVFNTLQTVIVVVLLVFVEEFDFFALLLIVPCAYSILNFQRKTAYLWIGGIILLMELVLLFEFPLEESVGYMIIYPAAIFLYTAFSYLALEAERAQMRSEALLADLQAANRKLQDYAVQVQALAAAEERNRLARELHDSVTQIIFGLTLSAQAARILLDRDPGRVAGQLDHMQALAQNALAEMRALIQQLHLPQATEKGLAEALRRLAVERESVDGLAVALQIDNERRLPDRIEEGLFRIAQEALNNVAKHARTGRAEVKIDMDDGNRVVMCIEDAGAGFDPARARSRPGHLGLTSMHERVEALGGKLLIDSQPGRGTRVQVELALTQEVKNA